MSRSFRTGRLAHDPMRVAAARSARFGDADTPPPSLPVDPTYRQRMWGNDDNGDCVVVTTLTSARLFSRQRAGTDLGATTAEALSFFAICLGMPDATPAQLAAAPGLVILDAMERAQAGGIPVGGERLVPDCRAIRPGDQRTLALGMARLGSICVGVDLCQADLDAVSTGLWRTSAQDTAANEGHAISLWRYDGLGLDDTVYVPTWGRIMRATWRWVLDRMREAYALGWRQLMPPGPESAYDALWAAETA